MVSNVVNWSEVVEEVGVEGLAEFCHGEMTRREFESKGSLARSTVRKLGTKVTRSRARHALHRLKKVT